MFASMTRVETNSMICSKLWAHSHLSNALEADSECWR